MAPTAERLDSLDVRFRSSYICSTKSTRQGAATIVNVYPFVRRNQEMNSPHLASEMVFPLPANNTTPACHYSKQAMNMQMNLC